MAKKRAPVGTDLPLSQATLRLRGRVILYNHKGQPVAASWPRKRPEAPTEAQAEQRAEFAAMARATKFVDTIQQLSARMVAEGSKYTWRDILSLAMTGQLGDFPNYGEIVSQYTLDVLGKEPGMIVIRTSQWVALAIGAEAQVLTVIDGLPTWSDLPPVTVELTGPITGTLTAGEIPTTIEPTGVTPDTYPFATIQVGADGRIIDAEAGTIPDPEVELTGPVTGTLTAGEIATTIEPTGVTAGSYTLASITVDDDGRITDASTGTAEGTDVGAHPGFASGRYYTCEMAAPLTQVSMTANRIYAVPFYVGKAFTFTKMGAFITVTASGNIEFGVYSNTDGAPDQLIHDCGSRAITGNNTVSEITGQTINLSPGWYWLAAAASVTPAVRCTTGSEGSNWNTIGGTNLGTGTVCYTGCFGAWTYSAGNLPSTFPTPTFQVSATPVTFIGT